MPGFPFFKPLGLVHAEPEFALLDGRRKEDHCFSALKLKHWWFQRIDLTGWPELHRAPERRFVHFSKLVTHLVAVQRPRALNRHLEQRSRNRRRGLRVIRI